MDSTGIWAGATLGVAAFFAGARFLRVFFGVARRLAGVPGPMPLSFAAIFTARKKSGMESNPNCFGNTASST